MFLVCFGSNILPVLLFEVVFLKRVQQAGEGNTVLDLVKCIRSLCRTKLGFVYCSVQDDKKQKEDQLEHRDSFFKSLNQMLNVISFERSSFNPISDGIGPVGLTLFDEQNLTKHFAVKI
jgi:hypothetical protein